MDRKPLSPRLGKEALNNVGMLEGGENNGRACEGVVGAHYPHQR